MCQNPQEVAGRNSYSYVRKFSSFRKFSACESSKSFMAMTAQKLAWNSGWWALALALGVRVSSSYSVEMKLREKPVVISVKWSTSPIH